MLEGIKWTTNDQFEDRLKKLYFHVKNTQFYLLVFLTGCERSKLCIHFNISRGNPLIIV